MLFVFLRFSLLLSAFLFVCVVVASFVFLRFLGLGPFFWHPYSSNASVMDIMSVALLAPSVLLLCFPLLTASVLTVALVARPSDPGNHPRHGAPAIFKKLSVLKGG